MIVVTGGAGFIGSAIAAALNSRGYSDLWIVDVDDHLEKKRNLSALTYERYLSRETFLDEVLKGSLPSTEAIFHLGACSSTTEMDVDFLNRNNVNYTRALAEYCLSNNVRFIYASSAATYGNGDQGYLDDEGRLQEFKPLNPYGQSKHDFDLLARQQGWLDRIVGLKYFNVYGPNEYHKEDMRSMVLKGFQQIRETGRLRLFKSDRPEYTDGGQVRDFLYVKDAVAMTLFFLDQKEKGGVFNIGSGRARSWNDLAKALFDAMELESDIEYFDMPDHIKNQYQYHTEAAMEKLHTAGFQEPCMTLEQGVEDYVRNFLMKNYRRLGEE
ncbi:MAG: ADP-glyceromanno-heptose 6-epimerase [Candidatus Nitronauta litoralis]|uniref:ADP-L-glycero-D-manno-heptose-6-epimerase n=1 Tax=Candidatus Nitronauta litoralis TaxID=2705533 RepID=A0A7T0G0J6_9BACT|nr:MAG: ADP-glyceromanno-heptose 6-epimerase [Candidatus Nitronauta litoralis]